METGHWSIALKPIFAAPKNNSYAVETAASACTTNIAYGTGTADIIL